MIRGVWTYTKPDSWKKLWIAPASVERTRATAAIVLVLGRKCAIVRRYSKLWRFFARGYVSPGHSPTILKLLLAISNFCLPLDSTIRPLTSTEHPVVSLLISVVINDSSIFIVYRSHKYTCLFVCVCV